jgi:CBS-domain-containing membrane protein
MSPRAAWRLEAAGFGPVHEYAAGKADWLAADLPFDGTAQLAGMFTRRGVATVGERTTAVGTMMRFGVSTVRPSEDAPALAHRMSHRGVTSVVVTRSEGTLVGLFFAEDMTP